MLKTGRKLGSVPPGNLGADFHECGGNNRSEWWEPPKGVLW